MTARRHHFRNATLFDSEHGAWIAGVDVLTEGDAIQAVSRERLEVAEAIEIDCTGRYLLPGLIDAHVHVTATIPDFFLLSQQPTSLIAAQSKDILEGMLARGFTTVRDAGGADAGLVQAIDRGHFQGPNLRVAGQALTQTGGHGDARPAFFAGSGGGCISCAALGLLGVVADGVSEVRRAVREQIRNGAHHIKVMAGGGISTPNDPLEGTQYSLEELVAIVEEAAAARTYVMAHAYAPEAIERAVRSGVRSIEHGNLLDHGSAHCMARHGAFLVPTLVTYDAITRNGARLGWPAAMLKKADLVSGRGLDAIRIAAEAGVKIGFGTDLLGEEHPDQSKEFILRRAAQPAADVLRSATWINAELLGLAGTIGVVATGAQADLIVLDRDPLADIAVMASPADMSVIMKGGRLYRAPRAIANATA